MKDYIEREKVLNDLLDQCKITGYGGLTANDVKYVFSLQTAADVRPVARGEWIEHYEHYDTGEEEREAQYGYVCSVCGRWEYKKEPFCNCGADMRGEN